MSLISSFVMRCMAALGLLICISGNAVAQPTYDLVISNGRVMDPETGLDAVRNIGITNGRITEISSKELAGHEVIDASGLVVAPGFIDLHAHVQSPLTLQLHAQDGVTTALELELGVFPIDRWYEDREGKSPINFGASVSHQLALSIAKGALSCDYLATSDGTVESASALYDDEAERLLMAPATADVNNTVEKLMLNGLEAGALGFGFFIVEPFDISPDEMLDLYSVAAKNEVGSFVHMRSFGLVPPLEAAEEIVTAARQTGAAIHVVHVNSSGLWQTREVMEAIRSAQEEGLAVTTEAYPYTAASSSMNDPRITEENMKKFGMQYSDYEFVPTGERLTQESFLNYQKTHPNAELAVHIMSEADVAAAVASPFVAIASDGGDFIDGKGHPRGAGTFSRVLARYVREQNSLSLMEGLRKMTLMPAQILQWFVPQMTERGRIQTGMIADITIFDPETIMDEADFADPDAPSKGIFHVIVNGEPVVSDGRFNKTARPGVAIRNTISGSGS